MFFVNTFGLNRSKTKLVRKWRKLSNKFRLKIEKVKIQNQFQLSALVVNTEVLYIEEVMMKFDFFLAGVLRCVLQLFSNSFKTIGKETVQSSFNTISDISTSETLIKEAFKKRFKE